MMLGTNRMTSAAWLRVGEPLYSSDDPPKGTSGDDDNPTDPPSTPKGTRPDGWTDEMQEFMNGIVGRETRAAAAAERRRVEAELERQRAEAAAEEQRKRDEEAGAFEKVKASLVDERDSARAELTSVTTERDAYKSFFDDSFADALKELPDTITMFCPKDDASYEDKVDWLRKAKEAAPKVTVTSPRGNGPNPPPRTERRDNEQEEVSRIRSRVRL